MAEIDFETLPVKDTYQLMVDVIVPRPIAWVSTISKKGIANLAPFSFYNGVCSDPPTLLISITPHPDGQMKDTLRNIRATKQFVVNLASRPLAEQMNKSSGRFSAEISEFEEVGLTRAPSLKVKPPRVAESPVSMECQLKKIVSIGEKNSVGSANIVIGQVVQMHVADDCIKNGKIISEKLQAIGRLGGPWYTTTQDLFQMPRPR